MVLLVGNKLPTLQTGDRRGRRINAFTRLRRGYDAKGTPKGQAGVASESTNSRIGGVTKSRVDGYNVIQ